jgi:ABC-2 type transport system ATP-binding protein
VSIRSETGSGSVAQLRDVTKRLGAVTALASVSLDLPPASTVALLGPNGAGKTTLLSMLLGLRRPDRGSVRVLDRDPRDHRVRTGIGATPQELLYPGTLRVEEIVRFTAAHYPAPASPGTVLEEFGLAQVARRQVGGLSGGQRRRLGLALAFVGRPALVILDEPTASLDADGRAVVWRAIRAARDSGRAVVVATHDLVEAEQVADRVALIDRGRLVLTGTVAEVKARAGGARVSFAADRPPDGFDAHCSDGRVCFDTVDAGRTIASLVRRGTALHELEVRRLTLAEALERIGSGT